MSWAEDRTTALSKATDPELSTLQACWTKIAELEQKLAETERLLAMAEGEEGIGLSGWAMVEDEDFNIWRCSPSVGWRLEVCRRYVLSSWRWEACQEGVILDCGIRGTIREAVAAAKAAYDRAKAGDGTS